MPALCEPSDAAYCRPLLPFEHPAVLSVSLKLLPLLSTELIDELIELIDEVVALPLGLPPGLLASWWLAPAATFFFLRLTRSLVALPAVLPDAQENGGEPELLSRLILKRNLRFLSREERFATAACGGWQRKGEEEKWRSEEH